MKHSENCCIRGFIYRIKSWDDCIQARFSVCREACKLEHKHCHNQSRRTGWNIILAERTRAMLWFVKPIWLLVKLYGGGNQIMRVEFLNFNVALKYRDGQQLRQLCRCYLVNTLLAALTSAVLRTMPIKLLSCYTHLQNSHPNEHLEWAWSYN